MVGSVDTSRERGALFDTEVERSRVAGTRLREEVPSTGSLSSPAKIAEQLDIHAPQIAPAIRAQLLILDENSPDAEIERHLDRAWKQRAMSFTAT